MNQHTVAQRSTNVSGTHSGHSLNETESESVAVNSEKTESLGTVGAVWR